MSLEEKVNNAMIEKNFVFSDIHYPEHDRKALSVAEQVMKDLKPQRLIYIGDFLNMTPVSHWMEDKKRPMEGQRLTKDYNGWYNKLTEHVKMAGKGLKEVVLLEGNHEDWINQYLDKHSEMEGLIEVKTHIAEKLADEYPDLKVTWVKYNQFYKLGKLYFTHGIYTNKYHASKHLESLGRNVMYGHTHTVQEHTSSNAVDGEKHSSKSIGCLADMSPSYMRNRPHQWVHAFAVVYTDASTGNFTDYVVKIINGATVWNGKLYKGQK
jgi:predicted phosphodiesterase